MHPSCINSNNCSTSFSTIDRQKMTSFGCYNHETPNLETTNNGKSLEAYGGDSFNRHVFLENNCLTGKRSAKKDRHRKINTARGPKDRRMRLSLDVAKKFFRLQDLLGFDKASNTIQWLLIKSKPAIQDLRLQQLKQTPFSASECELLSGIDDQVITKKKENFISKRFETGVRKIVDTDHTLAKETREKARARARKRTSEKRSIKLDQYSELKPSENQVIMDQNSSWIPFGEDQLQLTDQAEYDNSFMMSSNWSPSLLFNYQHNLGPSHEHQFSDFQILGKPWEGINN